jgi:hypothetical protein
MSTDAARLLQNADNVTADYALYFSLDDRRRHTDAPSFLALITGLSLTTVVYEVLKIVGQHLVERATDGALDPVMERARALKSKLTAQVRDDKAGRRATLAASNAASDETVALVELMRTALEASPPEEIARALDAGEVAITAMVRTELGAPDSNAAAYAVAITREIRISLNKR